MHAYPALLQAADLEAFHLQIRSGLELSAKRALNITSCQGTE